MDVTFVLEESGVTATVEVPCEADVAAAKEVGCTALAVSPASVEMRIGTQVLEGTCRLQDTAFGAGVQVVLARPRLADIKCPAQYHVKSTLKNFVTISLSRCGTLCISGLEGNIVGFDTETFARAFEFEIGYMVRSPPAISQCKTRCYLACLYCLVEVALPGGEVLRKIDGPSYSVFACGGVVVSQGNYGVSVYDENLTLLRTLLHKGCDKAAVSDCGGWVITSSEKQNDARLWDVNTGEGLVSASMEGRCDAVALSPSITAFAVGGEEGVRVYGSELDEEHAACRDVSGLQFTPCGRYLVVRAAIDAWCDEYELHQYDVATMSRVLVIPDVGTSFAISPCSRVVVFGTPANEVLTRHLYPH